MKEDKLDFFGKVVLAILLVVGGIALGFYSKVLEAKIILYFLSLGG